MKKLIFLIFLFSITPAAAQNPTCPTRPFGDNTNACASTAFVQAAVAATICTATGAFRVGTGSSTQCSTVAGAQAIVGSGPAAPAGTSLTINSFSSSLLPAFYSFSFAGGTTSTAAPSYNQFICDDRSDTTNNFGSCIVGVQQINGGRGGRATATFYNQYLSTMTPGSTNPFYGALNGVFFASANDNGTGITAHGIGTALGVVSELSNGATFWDVLTGMEIDVAVHTGASVTYLAGAMITTLATHQVSASLREAGLVLSAATGSIGLVNGIMFTDWNGANPLKATGTAIGASGTATIDSFISVPDTYTITTNLLRGAGNIDLSSTVVAQKILYYHGGNAKYGFGLAANEGRWFVPSDSHASIGTISTGDGTTWTERFRFAQTNVFSVFGTTSGSGAFAPQAAMGSAVYTLPTGTGTIIVTASSPLVASATTGNIACATCVTSSGGGAIIGVAPVAVSAAGAVSITGAAGQVLAGASPAFTATPTLGASGTSGSIAFGNATSGTVTLQTVTGALGSVTSSLPATTTTLAGLAVTQTFSAVNTFSSATASTTTATGAVVLSGASGGIGVAGRGNFGGNVAVGGAVAGNCFNSLTITGMLVKVDGFEACAAGIPILVNRNNTIGAGIAYYAAYNGTYAGSIDINAATTGINVTSVSGMILGATGVLALSGTSVTAATLANDTATTDNTVCISTASNTLLKGTGSLGICLGTSGRQFKTAFAPMLGGLEEIAKLKLWNYRYKEGYGDSGERMQYGPTAQDVAAVLPDLARSNEKGEMINYDSGALLFIGLRAIQQLKAANDNLELRVGAIEKRRGR